MLHVPKWILDIMKGKRFACRECASRFDARGVKACGVRESQRDPSMEVMFIEYQCQRCKRSVTLEFQEPCSVAEFAAMVLEVSEEQTVEESRRADHKPKFHKGGKKAMKKSKSRITKAEQKQVADLMDQCDSYLEFLRRIGAPMDLAQTEPDQKDDFKVRGEEE